MTTFRYQLVGYAETFEIQAKSRFDALQAIASVFCLNGRLPTNAVRFV